MGWLYPGFFGNVKVTKNKKDSSGLKEIKDTGQMNITHDPGQNPRGEKGHQWVNWRNPNKAGGRDNRAGVSNFLI